MQVMHSRCGVATVQRHMCFSKNQGKDCKPWEKQKPGTDLNPERMTRGITREEFKELKQEDADPADEDESDIDDDSVGGAEPFDENGDRLTRDQILKLRILKQQEEIKQERLSKAVVVMGGRIDKRAGIRANKKEREAAEEKTKKR